LVELKNGETYNGHLVNCDNWMNINLRDVICTSRVSSYVHTVQMNIAALFYCILALLFVLWIFKVVVFYSSSNSTCFIAIVLVNLC